MLPVGADFWAKLPPGAGWEQFYLALLLDIRTRDLSPKLRDPDIRKALESRRLNNGPGAIRDLVGHIDHVNIWEVRGWCGDEAGAGEDLVIEIFVDTIFVGTVSCDQLRPDVQRLLGGNGIYGFTFSFSASHLDLFQVDRWISAREQTTKRTFGRILFPRSSHPERIDHLARLHRELEQIRTVLDRIEAELPEQARQFSYPLSAYSEYFAAYVQCTEERVTVYRNRLDDLPSRPAVSIMLFVDTPCLEAIDMSIRSVKDQVYSAWELVVVVCNADALGDAVRSFLARQARSEPRIRLVMDELAVEPPDRVAPVGECSGGFVGFLKCGDRLSPDALFHAMSVPPDRPTKLIYADEDGFEAVSYGPWVHHSPKFKPDFDFDLLLSHDYLGNFLLVSAQLLAQAGPLAS